MDYVIAGIVVLFVAAAIQDYRKREVSDYITIIAWGLSAFVFNLQYFVLFFCGTWAIASVFERIKKPLLSFGDVLFFPVYAGLINYLGQEAILFSLVTILVAQFYLWYRLEWEKTPKEKVKGSPFVVVMLLMLGVAFLTSSND
jgi:hypothetical protein